ncbi:substrate-binding domain-containing protein [Mesorhizobium sp.]|uniref:substrate-binding domain-containing protein n=1 Tax=Mesorhizobium sp. TaxID=1871066 RepID=UPI0025D19040|nr:substrate-binding domain-containing protein [Mesorhizobium sp.]
MKIEIRGMRSLGACSLAKVLSAAIVGAVVLAAPTFAQEKRLKIVHVGVAAPTGFFAYLNKGAEDAAKDLGVDFTYVFPSAPTLPAQVETITAAMAGGADGIIINGIGDDKSYYDVIEQGKAQGIAFGSALGPQAGKGTQLRELADPFLFHVGADEYAGGVAIGKKLLETLKSGHVVVGNPQPGDSATCQPRAAGVVDTLKAANLTAEVQELTLDPGQIAETMTNYLRAHPDTKAMVSACSPIAPYLEAKERAERADLALAGWDLDETGVAALRSGKLNFTIDQQQYWRGYMPVLLMTHYLKYGLIPANAFLTGPAIVDQSNIDKVAPLVSAGYR